MSKRTFKEYKQHLILMKLKLNF